MIVRTAEAEEAEAVGELRVAAYRAQNLLAASPGYAGTLRGLGFGSPGTVLVAADDGGGVTLLGFALSVRQDSARS